MGVDVLNGAPGFSVSSDDVARCQALVSEIDARARKSGAYEVEREWVSPGGIPVHTTTLRPTDITRELLAELPQRAHFFTGWPPAGPTLNSLGSVVWAALRFFPPNIAARVYSPWWHRLQRTPAYYAGLPTDAAKALADWHARRLPQELRPGLDFDGTVSDRLALCERLTAMLRLGLFRRLSAIEHPVVLEIGAGYGMLAAALRRAYPKLTYLIVDLPSSLVLSGCYLTSRGAGRVSLIGKSTSPDASEIGLVVNTELAAIEGRPIDVAINTLSFGEMSESVVEGYAAFVRRNLAPDGVLFEQNFDNTHFDRPGFCNPRAVLQRHLYLSSVLAGDYLKGQPRLWEVARRR